MCVIIYKPLGVANPSDETFQRAESNNPDGWGMLIRDGGKIRVERGFGKDAEAQLLEAVHRNSEHEYAVHARIGTHGAKGLGNTHPFLVHDDMHMMHNGIIDIDDVAAPDMCDSYHYAKFLEDCLAKRPAGIGAELRRTDMQEWMAKHIGGSKLLFMDQAGAFIVNADKFGAHWKDGVWYSNSSAHYSSHYTGNVKVYNYGRGGTWPKKYGECAVPYGDGFDPCDDGTEDDDMWKDALSFPSYVIRKRAERIRNQRDEDANFVRVLGLVEEFQTGTVDELATFAYREPEMTADVLAHLLSIQSEPEPVVVPEATIVTSPILTTATTYCSRKARQRARARKRFYVPALTR